MTEPLAPGRCKGWKIQHARPVDDCVPVQDPKHPSRCQKCGNPVKLFPPNEGPESLKALLTFK